MALTLVALTLAAACGRTVKPIRYPRPFPIEELEFRASVNYPTFTLPNGLIVVLAPDAESNLVTVDMRYFVGATDEVKGKTGLAHLAEHVTFGIASPSSASSDNRTIAARLGEHALVYNALTGYDNTHYTAVALARSLERLIEIEAQRMTATCEQVPAELLERERAVVLQEQAQRAAAQAPILDLHRLVWGADHPLGRSVGGDDVATLTRDDYCAFVARHYVPANAALIIGGKINVNQTKAMVARHFKGIAGGVRPPRPMLTGPRPRHAAHRAQLPIAHPAAMAVFPLEPQGTDKRLLQTLAIAVMQGELGRVAAEEDGVVSARVIGLGGDRHAVVALALSSDTVPHDKLVSLMQKATERASRLMPPPAVERWKARLITGAVADHDDMLDRGELIGDYSQFTVDDRYYVHEIEVVSQLTPQELSRITAGLFDWKRAVTYHLDQREDAPPSYELATSGEGRRYDLPPSNLPTAGSPAELLTAAAPVPKPVELTLPNGLRAVLVPRRQDAFFEARFVLPVGDADDPPGKAGTAGLTARLLTLPSFGLGLGDQLALYLAAMTGSAMAARTTAHTTELSIRGLSSQARIHLWSLHTLLENGEHDEDLLDGVRRVQREHAREEASTAQDPAVIAERRKQRLRDEVRARLLGAEHPFLQANVDLRHISVDDLIAFRERNYAAGGALLVVVGGFDPEQVSRAIYDLWGPWKKQTVPATRPMPPARPQKGQAFLALDRPDSQLALVLSFAAEPSAASTASAVATSTVATSTTSSTTSDAEQTRTAAERMVAAELLNNRLADLRDRLAASYGIALAYRTIADTSIPFIEGRVAPDRGVEILRELRATWDLGRGDPGALTLEVARARHRALQKVMAQSSSSSSIVATVVELALAGKPLDQPPRVAAEISAVTTDRLRARIQADFADERMVMAASGPGASDVLRQAGGVQIQIIP